MGCDDGVLEDGVFEDGVLERRKKESSDLVNFEGWEDTVEVDFVLEIAFALSLPGFGF
jgi:hypothetical protein